MQPDLRMNICEHIICFLQHQVYSFRNKRNIIGHEWLKEGNEKQHFSVKHDLMASNHTITVAFQYNPADYRLSQHVLISAITEVCPYCKTLKFKGETKGMFCTTGKIKLPQLGEPPEPLKTLLAIYTAESKHFLYNIPKYN
ncbi:uncharacterized protein TNCV_2067681 [Trichonephila clavipes]|uniref:Uncharacterized protein n=1 Tax=Trichonephila clavipes TaxID=2585209 RepID=A0A8X6W332_TRICX|nr:uncharacterized protein TNCV_2067681 [Trichonephila clavipes]